MRSRSLEQLVAEQKRFLDFLTPRVGSQEAARDVLQAALLKAMERGGAIESEERTTAWFYRLLRNALIDRARSASAEQRALGRVAAQTVLDEESAQQLERHVCACVETLTEAVKPEYAAVLKAVEVDGQALTEFAATAQITAGNARVRLHRAREAVTRRLLELCGTCCAQGCASCPCEV